MKFKSLLIDLGLYRPKYRPDENYIELLNCWTKDPEKLWQYHFVIMHFSNLLTPQNSLLIGSVFGPKGIFKLSKSRKKLFYTGENVDRFPEYNDYCEGIVDLSIGFDYMNKENYQRFPLWMEYFFAPVLNHKKIHEVFSEFVNKDICRDEDKKFAVMVSRHDEGNSRAAIFNSLSQIGQVDSGGQFLKNTNALQEEFADDKGRFIGQYKFNICPENSNREGYVTEKVFEAIKSNTIPIYWGSNNNPEPDVLNKDAILFYDGPESLPALNRQVEELHNNPKLYKEFMAQPKFQPQAVEYVIDAFEGLHGKLNRMLTMKK